MTLSVFRRRLVPALVALGFASASLPSVAAPADGKVIFAPHRAVYDLKLKASRGSRGMEAVRGRILYDFSGSACEGYRLQFRQVSELSSSTGRSVLSDLRSTSWEDGEAKKFTFGSENRLDERTGEIVDGAAVRGGKTVKVTLNKPKRRTLHLPGDAVFPTEHMRRIILAARQGVSILQLPVYDGSDDGQKVYSTLTVIGKPIAAGEKPPDDAAADSPELAALTRWPVTISYFEQRGEKERHKGEQTPVYAIGFELYENGISRALLLDYADFTLTGKMTLLEVKKAKPCK
jgi:hypothetical protein